MRALTRTHLHPLLIPLCTALLLGLGRDALAVTAGVGVNLIENGNFDADPGANAFSTSVILSGWEDGGWYGDTLAGDQDTAAKALTYVSKIFVSNTARTRFFDLPSGGFGGPLSGLNGNYYYSGEDTTPLSQTVVVTNAALQTLIRSGTAEFRASGYFGGWEDQDDRVDLHVTFLNQDGAALDEVLLGGVDPETRRELKDTFVWRFAAGKVPRDTDHIRFQLQATNSFASNSGTADALSFTIVPGAPQPPVTNGLQVHLAADFGVEPRIDGMEVTSWVDRQNGHVFEGTGATYVAQDDTGLPAIDLARLPGSGFMGDFSSTAGGFVGDATIFVVARFDGYEHDPASSSYFFSIDSSTDGSEHTLGRDLNAPNTNALYHWRGQPSPQAAYGTDIREPIDGRFVPYTSIFRGANQAEEPEMEAWIDGSDGGARAPDLSHDGSAYRADPSRTRIGNWTSGANGLDGLIREVLIYNRVLTEGEITAVETYLAARTMPVRSENTHTYYVRLSSKGPPAALGLVPNGDPEVGGFGKLVFSLDEGSRERLNEYDIRLSNNRYRVATAHVYNLFHRPWGDSYSCWGGRWSTGYDSLGFLNGHNFTNVFGNRLTNIESDQSDGNPATDWYVMLHTEGGHFATTNGNLIPYYPVGDHNTSLMEGIYTGSRDISETGIRFNARVPRRLGSLALRETSPVDSQGCCTPFPNFDRYNPAENEPQNTNYTPFPDANGKMWLKTNTSGDWVLTEEAVANGYDLNTEYLFYLYDDQALAWDYGGPEGAMIGRLEGEPADAFLFYEDWIKGSFPLLSPDSRKDADPDGDGWDNRFEHVFGSRPDVANPEDSLFASRLDDEGPEPQFKLEFDLSKFHAAGVVQVSRSTDLKHWKRFWRENRLAMSDPPVVSLDDQGTRWRIQLSDPVPASETVFYRFDIIE